jgi:hypothetical protein
MRGIRETGPTEVPEKPDFPTIGNFFSNHWKNGGNFFQSLENLRKNFPIIGKIGPVFPTIGKKFSNRWKIPRARKGFAFWAGNG